MALYEILKQDLRHTDLRVISMKSISMRSFGHWEMKYLPAERDVKALLRSFGMASFEPYRFDEAMTEKMLTLLVNGSNLDLAVEAGESLVSSVKSDCSIWK